VDPADVARPFLLAQVELLDLARGGLGQFGQELDLAGRLTAGDPRPDSTSMVAMFSPPDTTTSLARSRSST
jgi:hypothetical protein